MKGKWIALLLACTASGAAAQHIDLIIRGGTIYTGSDAPFIGDVAVSGDRIRAVGRRLNYRAARAYEEVEVTRDALRVRKVAANGGAPVGARRQSDGGGFSACRRIVLQLLLL